MSGALPPGPRRTCGAPTKAGKPCSMPLWRPEAERCLQHDSSPEAAERRRARAVKGGLASHKRGALRPSPGPLQPSEDVASVEELRGLLGGALRRVLAGQLDTKVAHAAAALAGQLARLLLAGEAEDVEELLREVKRRCGAPM